MTTPIREQCRVCLQFFEDGDMYGDSGMCPECARKSTKQKVATLSAAITATGGTTTKGFKYDDGKERYDLLPPHAMRELARVYTFGANKYSPRGWEAGMAYSRVFSAIFRHLFAFWAGQTYDQETKLHHLAHAAWGCLALVQYHYTAKGEDDRP